MEGVGEHGNMICIDYQGNQTDLNGLTIEANINQGDKVIEANIPIDSVEGQDCFELIDAKYNVGEPVSIKLFV